MPPYHFRCRTTTVAHFEPADTWQKASHWAIDGEVPDKERSGLIDFARNSSWGTHWVTWPRGRGGDGRKHPTVFTHFQNHKADMAVSSLEEYNQKIFSLIRRSGRDVYLVTARKQYPAPKLYFFDEKTLELAAIDVKTQRFLTCFKVADIEKGLKEIRQGNELAVKLPEMQGVTKWIKSLIS